MKKCTQCKQEKALKDFNKDKANKTGLTTRCKQCMKDYKIKRKHQEIVAFDFYE